MPLVTSTKMFEQAYKNGYAIGAFNVNNLETIQGIVNAGVAQNAPLILQVSSGARKYANPTYLQHLVLAAVEESGLPICLHLDHGDSFELCKSCIDKGFTSVMIDASKYPLPENIRITKEVVAYAHDHGVVVEGELGRLAGVPTPITDAHVTLSEAMMGRDYHAEGVNLEKMGLDGKTIEQVLDYVTRG